MDYTSNRPDLSGAPSAGQPQAAGRSGAAVGVYRPSLTFYHPNAKGTGCALSMDLHPAHDGVDGCFMMRVACQSAVGDPRAARPTFARFDWERSIRVKLDFNDLCQILQVFRGASESIADGRGLYHRSPKAATRIVLRHLVEPVVGYSLELYRTPVGGEGESRAHILLTPSEARGLCEAVAGSMSVICFGIPTVIAHDTSAYRESVREARHAVPA